MQDLCGLRGFFFCSTVKRPGFAAVENPGSLCGTVCGQVWKMENERKIFLWTGCGKGIARRELMEYNASGIKSIVSLQKEQ